MPVSSTVITQKMNETELKINKLAQGLIPFEEGLAWYDESDAEFRNKIMKVLDLCIYQSHPTNEDIEEGIKESGLKETYSPCVLVRKKPFNDVRQKVLNMPEPDLRRSFILFLSIFGAADKHRRETLCKGGCTHEWHNIGL
ncbi:hypothetical protein MNBD_GAMMA12-3207 [hydrothermal vent metagenome]|uniref:Uncharacterized protein n=1 Tax=hydrothermal vent metagenome TaxID=652676 RepID=A0A3B0YR92_9ZZZZ